MKTSAKTAIPSRRPPVRPQVRVPRGPNPESECREPEPKMTKHTLEFIQLDDEIFIRSFDIPAAVKFIDHHRSYPEIFWVEL